MYCPMCGEQLNANTTSCPKCGAPVPNDQPQMKAGRKIPKAFYAAMVVLLVIIIAALMLRRGPSLTQGETEAPTPGPVVTNAPPPNAIGGPSVTNAPPPTAPPPGQPVAAPLKPKAPQEVLDYLAFVKQAEATRQALLRDTARALTMSAGAGAISQMLNWIDESQPDRQDPYSDLKKELGVHIQHWQILVRQFDAKPAPPACAEFAGAYRASLTSEFASIYRVASVVTNINVSNTQSIQDAVGQLEKMKGDPSTQGNIDRSVEQADGKLTQLCAKYGIDKPFDVKKESDSGGSIIGGL